MIVARNNPGDLIIAISAQNTRERKSKALYFLNRVNLSEALFASDGQLLQKKNVIQ